MCSDEAWTLSPINAVNITALHEKYSQARVVIATADFDSPAFKQQAGAYLEVSLADVCNENSRKTEIKVRPILYF